MPSDERLIAWIREHAIALKTIDPDAPLDDLEPLRELVGDARVVAIGENAHYVPEFSLLRDRVTRFLVERCGFTLIALEAGFSEGFALADWAQGAGEPGDLEELAEACLAVGMGRVPEYRAGLGWVRERNRAGCEPGVRYVGIDVPVAGGSLLPALEPLEPYLAEVDEHALPLLRRALEIAATVAGASMAKSGPIYGALEPERQDELTATLARLLNRMQALEARCVAAGGRERYDVALWRLQGALHTDVHLRGMSDLMAGADAPGSMTARDLYMAESVKWVLDRAEPGARLVMGVHNLHIQKAEVHHSGQFQTLPMGHHLARIFGDDYVALGVTCGRGRTTELAPTGEDHFGMTAEDKPLALPEEGSVEAAFAQAGVNLGLVPLRGLGELRAAGVELPELVRLDTAYLPASPIETAFDAIFHIPETSTFPELEGLRLPLSTFRQGGER